MLPNEEGSDYPRETWFMTVIESKTRKGYVRHQPRRLVSDPRLRVIELL